MTYNHRVYKYWLDLLIVYQDTDSHEEMRTGQQVECLLHSSLKRSMVDDGKDAADAHNFGRKSNESFPSTLAFGTIH